MASLVNAYDAGLVSATDTDSLTAIKSDVRFSSVSNKYLNPGDTQLIMTVRITLPSKFLCLPPIALKATVQCIRRLRAGYRPTIS